MPSSAETIRALWSDFEAAGLDAVLARLDGDVRYTLALAEGRVLHGSRELRDHLSALAADGAEVHARVDRVEELGDIVLVRGTLRVERWGALSESTMVWGHRVEDGRLREVVASHSRAEALARLQALDGAGT